jgi:hypothetical protein
VKYAGRVRQVPAAIQRMEEVLVWLQLAPVEYSVYCGSGLRAGRGGS